MATTKSDINREKMVDQILADHKDELREELRWEIEDEIRDEIRDELLEDSEFLEEALDQQDVERIAWVPITDDEIQNQVSRVATSLKDLLECIRRDNQLPNQENIVDEIDRMQLIAILEAALAELKAPLVDRGRFRVLRRWVGKIFGRAVENHASQTLQDVLERANSETTEFVSNLEKMDNFGLF